MYNTDSCTHCANCYEMDVTYRCSCCRSSYYCSRECQINHWHMTHKYQCWATSATKLENSDAKSNSNHNNINTTPYEQFCCLIKQTGSFANAIHMVNVQSSINKDKTADNEFGCIRSAHCYSNEKLILIIYKYLTGFQQAVKVSKSKYVELYYRQWTICGSQETGTMTRAIHYSTQFLYRMVVQDNKDRFTLRIIMSESRQDESRHAKKIQDSDCKPSSFSTDQIQFILSNPKNAAILFMGGVENYFLASISQYDAINLNAKQWIKLIKYILKYHRVQFHQIQHISMRLPIMHHSKTFAAKFEREQQKFLLNNHNDDDTFSSDVASC